MINKVYIVDYESVTYIAGGKGIGMRRQHLQEIGRDNKTEIFYSKIEAVKTVLVLTQDPCIENIKLSVSMLERDYLDIEDIIKDEK